MTATAVRKEVIEPDKEAESVILDVRLLHEEMDRKQRERVATVLKPSEHGLLTAVAESANYQAERGHYGGKDSEKFSCSMGEAYLMPWAIGNHYDNARRIVDRINSVDPMVGEDDGIRTRMFYVFGPHLEEGSFTSPRLVFSRIGRTTAKSNLDGRVEVSSNEGLNDLQSQIKGDDVIREFNATGQRLLTRFSPDEPLVEIDLFRGLTADKRFDDKAKVKEAITYSVLQLACRMAPSYVSGIYDPEIDVSDEAFMTDISRYAAQRFAKYPDEKPLSHKHDIDKRRAFYGKETYANISTIFLPTKLEPGGHLDPNEQNYLKDKNGLFREIQSRIDPNKQKQLFLDSLPAYHGLENQNGHGWAMVEYIGEQEGMDALDPGSSLTLKEQLYNFSARCANWHLIHPDRHVEERHFLRVDIKDSHASHTHYRWLMLVRYTNKNQETWGHTPANEMVNLRRVPKDLLKYLEYHDPHFGKSLANPHHWSTDGEHIDHEKNKIQQKTRVGRFFAHQKSEWVQLKEDCEEAITFWESKDACVPMAEMHRRIFRDDALSDDEKKSKWLRYTQIGSISPFYAKEELRHLLSIITRGDENGAYDALIEYLDIERKVKRLVDLFSSEELMALLKDRRVDIRSMSLSDPKTRAYLELELQKLLDKGQAAAIHCTIAPKQDASIEDATASEDGSSDKNKEHDAKRLRNLIRDENLSIAKVINILAWDGLADRKLDQFIAEKMKPVLPFLCDQVHLNDLSSAALRDDNDPTLQYVLESSDGAMMEFQARNFFPAILGAVATDGRGAATLEFDMPMHGFDVAFPTNYKWSDQKNNFELIKGLVNRSILRPNDVITRSHFACSPYAELYGVDSPTPYVRYMVPLTFKDMKVASGEEKAPDFYEVGWNAYHWMNNLDARNARFAPIGSVYSRDNRDKDGFIDVGAQGFKYNNRKEAAGLMEVSWTSESLAATYNNEQMLTELGIIKPGTMWGTMFRRKVPGIDPHHSPRGWNWEDAKDRTNWFEHRSGKHVYNGKRLARAEIHDADWRMSWGPNLGWKSEEAAFMFELYAKIKIEDPLIDENTILEIDNRTTY